MDIIVERSCGLKILEKMRIRKVLPYIEGRLLDIGCGFNNLVKNYKGDGVGVDVFSWPGVDCIVKDSAHLDFASTTFDTVTFLACLNHIPNRLDALKEAYRLLRPEGKVIITMIPDKVGVLWHAIFERFWGESKKGRTFNEGEKGGIDAQEVILLLNQAGFRIEKKSKFMFGINNIIIGRK